MGPHPVQLSRGNNSSKLGTRVRAEDRWEEVRVQRVHKENFQVTNTAEEPGKSQSHKKELCFSIITWKHSGIKDYQKAFTTCCSHFVLFLRQRMAVERSQEKLFGVNNSQGHCSFRSSQKFPGE